MRNVLSREKSAGRLVFLAALMVILSLFLVAAKPAEAQGAGVNHIVQPGEYLAKIARNYGTTVHAIMAVNPQITNMNRIYPGQVIFVPIGWTPAPVPIPVPPPTTPPPPTVPPGPACRAWHYVTPGQTLLMISRWYGVDPFVIARANNIWNLNLIFWGTNLCIP